MTTWPTAATSEVATGQQAGEQLRDAERGGRRREAGDGGAPWRGRVRGDGSVDRRDVAHGPIIAGRVTVACRPP